LQFGITGLSGTITLTEPKHVHIQREKLLCKFWLEPIALGKNHGFSAQELNAIRRIIKSNLPKILEAWNEYCN
jgi:hypothetical protein